MKHSRFNFIWRILFYHFRKISFFKIWNVGRLMLFFKGFNQIRKCLPGFQDGRRREQGTLPPFQSYPFSYADFKPKLLVLLWFSLKTPWWCYGFLTQCFQNCKSTSWLNFPRFWHKKGFSYLLSIKGILNPLMICSSMVGDDMCSAPSLFF